MATTTKALFRGAATTTLTTGLYTSGASTTAVVTNIVVSNAAATASTVTVAINAINLLPTVSIPANSVATFDLKQVVPASTTVTGGASTTAVSIHISGVEIA